MDPSLAAVVANGRQLLEAAGASGEAAGRDAVLLARAVLAWDAASWLARSREATPPQFPDRFLALIQRRARHEPIAYITGTREFYGRAFSVNRDVLIPRPETEGVVEEALRCLANHPLPDERRRPVIVDVGTGSGCLAVTLALEYPSAEIFATDTSASALNVARANARHFDVADRIEFRRDAFFAGMSGPIDLVVSNPPYVRETDRTSLPPEVASFEPPAALFAGADGLDAIRALLAAAPARLARGGWLVMEIGHGQITHVRELIDGNSGLTFHHVRPDLQGIPRVVVARRSDLPSPVVTSETVEH